MGGELARGSDGAGWNKVLEPLYDGEEEGCKWGGSMKPGYLLIGRPLLRLGVRVRPSMKPGLVLINVG